MAQGGVRIQIVGEFNPKGFVEAEKAAEGLSGQMKGLAKTVGAAFATREVVNFAKSAVGAASDLGESINAVNVTFGDASDGILKLGENAAEAVGLSAREFNGFAVQFAGFTQQIAGSEGDIVAVTENLTTRIADFASVMNLDVPEAAQVFQSSLAGETEPIRKFGIDLSAAAVGLHAVEIGLVDSANEMTEADKVMARYSLLMEETDKVAGDFTNTSDSLANQQRILAARLDDAQATIGAALVPALESLLNVALPLIEAFTELPEGVQQTLIVGLGLVAAAKSMSTTLQGFGISAKNANKWVGGLTAGVGLALIAFNQYLTAKNEISAAAERVKQALDNETLAVTENTEGLIQQQFLTGELGKAMEMLGLDVDLATEAIMGNEEAAYEFIDAFKQAREDSVGLGDGLRSLFDGGMMAIDAARIVEREFEGMTKGMQDAKAESERLADAHEEVIEQSTYVADATDELTIINELATVAAKEFARKTNVLQESLGDVYSATNKLIPEIETLLGLFRQQDAVDDAADAIENYHEKLVDATVGSRELEQAQRDAAEAIFVAIEALGRIPENVQTQFKVLVEQGDLDAALRKLERLESARSQIAAIVAGTDPGSSYIANARDEMAAIAVGGQIGLVSSTRIGPPVNIPTGAMAEGGIVTRPTLALLAEKGTPEAVVPLNKSGGIGATYNITVQAGVGDPGAIGQQVVESIRAYERRNGAGWRAA